MKEINKATNFIYTNVRIPVLNSLIFYRQYSSDIFYSLYWTCFTYPLDTPLRSVIIFTSFIEPYLAKKLLISVSSTYGKEFDFKCKKSAFKTFNYSIKEDLIMWKYFPQESPNYLKLLSKVFLILIS